MIRENRWRKKVASQMLAKEIKNKRNIAERINIRYENTRKMSVLAICLTTCAMFTITFSSLRTAIIVDMVNMPGVSAKRRFRPTLATALDAVIRRLHISFERFFNIPGVGRPKYKKRGKYRSAKFQSGYLLEEGSVRLSFKAWDEPSQSFKFHKHWFSFHQHRDWKGTVRYIQILRDAVGTYWLSVVTDDTSKEVLPATGESVGADFGLKNAFLTLNTGEKIQSPQFLKLSLTELRKRSKSLSRKVKGSNNWWRCLRQLTRVYRKITTQRKDWQWKLATDLCRRFDTIVTETLNLEGMKRLWGRKVSELCFGQFVEILKFKCFKHHREFRQVGQWTPTTKPCSDCGHHNENLSLSDRQWTCPDCGCHHDRDINAAINILRAACVPSVER